MKGLKKAVLWCLPLWAVVCALALHAGSPGKATVPASSTNVFSLSDMKDGSLLLHFIDVGQADAILVQCGSENMLVDGGNSEDSNLIYSYLKSRKITHLDYLIATHAHEDHVGGLSGALNYASAGIVYCPVTSYDTRAFDSFLQQLTRQGQHITVPKVGTAFSLGSAIVKIVGPLQDAEDPNNTSIVLHITHGQNRFLLAADAEREEELDILESGVDIRADVLKVAHHGSDTSTTYPFLRTVAPKYAVICVGKGNTYGHPTENTLSKLQDADVTVYRTDLHGDILCVSDGKTIRFIPHASKKGRWLNKSAIALIGSIPKKPQ